MVQIMENLIGLEDKILTLLIDHPEGMSALEISKNLGADARKIKLSLVSLKNRNGISTGLRKFDGDYTFFERYYFCSI